MLKRVDYMHGRDSRHRWLTAAVWTGLVLEVAVACAVFVVQLHAVPTTPLTLALGAFPELLLFVAAILGVVTVILGVASRRRVLGVLASILLAVIVAGGFAFAVNRSPLATTVKKPTGQQLRVLSWNTNQQAVSVGQLRSVIHSTKPNIVALPEYFPQIAERSLAELAREEHMTILGSENSSATVLVSEALGDYRIVDRDTTPAWAGVVIAPRGGEVPPLLVAHLQRASFSSSATWSDHLRWVQSECNKRPGLIAVGDFNAVNANFGSQSLGRCSDVAADLDLQSTGTWPSFLPASLGAAIDHVMVSGRWTPVSYSVLSGESTGGSDHRPIFVVLRDGG